MKRIVIVSDLHCGHRSGLTPPGWQYEPDCDDQERVKFSEIQRGMWDWYKKEIESLKPIHAVLANGDLIDGKGEKTGGTEQLESDRTKQAEIAIECLRIAEPTLFKLVYGTSYHVGKEEDFERIIAASLKASIGGHEWYDVNGLIFDLKHRVSGSIIPHGRFTALAREQLWNELWSNRKGQPLADVIIRSHCHYHVHLGFPGRLALITPALQGWGSKFGIRQMSGVVDIGFVHFDVEDKENYTWQSHILNIESLSATAEVL